MGPRPRTPQTDELPRPRLDEQLKMSHPLVRLANLMNWEEIERSFGAHFTSSRGRPALSPRLVAGLLYLQHANDASMKRWWPPGWRTPTGNTFAVKPICRPSCPLIPPA